MLSSVNWQGRECEQNIQEKICRINFRINNKSAAGTHHTPPCLQPGSYVLNVIILSNQALLLCSSFIKLNDVLSHNTPSPYIDSHSKFGEKR